MCASGKPMRTVPSAGATLQSLFAAGYRLLPLAGDVGLTRDGARAVLDEVRGGGGE